MKNIVVFTEEAVSFTAVGVQIAGLLTLPTTPAPYPALVLLHGSDRSLKEDPYYTTHAEKLVKSGFAVLRYDGPGWGGQTAQNSGFETLESRTEEAVAIVKYLQTRPDIQADKVGLWGISQGGWICQMAATASDKVAFIIPTSGPGVTPAEQEVFRIEAESKAAGFSDNEVRKATLIRRLMVDIVLDKPVYTGINQAEAERLGPGPWGEVVDLVYGSQPVESNVEFENVLKLFHTIEGEAWTKALHLDQVIPMFDNLPPQTWEMAKGQMRAVLDVNPADFLTKVHCPVLAIFGEDDTSIPVAKSVALYQQYLKEAGNEDVTIKIFPKASHTIQVDGYFAPGYFDTINTWLSNLSFKEGKK